VSKPYYYPCQLEFEDVDAYGIAHHTKLIGLLERARVHMFHDQGLSIAGGELFLVLASMEIKFLLPAKMMDKLVVELVVASLGHVNVVLDYCIKRQEQSILQAKVKLASVDIKNMRLVPFSEPYRVVLQKYLGK